MKRAFEPSNEPSDHLLFWFICIPSPYSLPPSLTDESMDIPIMQHTLKEVDDLTQTEYMANEERSDLQSVETLYDTVSRAAHRTVYSIQPYDYGALTVTV